MTLRRPLAFLRTRLRRPTPIRNEYRPTLEALEDRCLLSVNVLTAHDDTNRDGLNAAETILTPADVNSAQFGKLFSVPVDGQVYAQPLYMSGLPIPGQGIHDVVFVATEHDSVYAFDANSGALLWHDSFINPAAGINPEASSNFSGNAIEPEIGITGTPVIDSATGTLYLVAATQETSGPTTNFVQRLHALDVTTGAEKFGGPVVIQASVPGSGDGGTTVTFQAGFQLQRAALLLQGGVVYVAWSSHGDATPVHGWVTGYSASTLQLVTVFNASPNTQLNTIWMSGGGLAADANGHVYFVTGNGPVSSTSNGFNPAAGDYAESVLNLATSGGLSVSDYFTPFNWQFLDSIDADFGSGGVVLFDQPGAAAPHLLVTTGKEGTIYLINRDNMGQFNAGSDSVVQELPGSIGGSFGSPAYFNNTIYYGGVGDTLKAFSLTNGLLSTGPTSHSAISFGYPGTTPSISANGTSNGIVWAIEMGSHAILHAYDATNLAHELYNSDQAGSRDQLDAAVKFTTPTIADGKVFVGTASQLTVFGLLQNLQVVAATPQGSSGTVNAVTLTFNEPIQAGTFTLASVDALTGPGGSITPTAVNQLSATQYQVTFPTQAAAGTYSLTIGPNVKNTNGIPMDQNGNGVNGENPADRYTTTFGLPLPTALPFQDNFNDGVANAFASQSGAWTVSGGRYGVTPFGVGEDALSLLQVSGALPSSLEFDVLMNAAAGTASNFSNGFVIFNYQGPTSFDYAGAFVGLQQWVVGHRDATGWHNDAAVSDMSIAPGTDYNLQLLLQGGNASILVNGVAKVGFTYASAFSGSVGLGTENSVTQFDNLTLQQPPSGTLPITENFDDGQAHFFSPQSGSWSVSTGRYGAAPSFAGGDAVSTLLINGALPSSLEFDVTMNATAGSGSFFSNGFAIFDYQSLTNFKFAGAFIGLQEWVVGHRDANGWQIDASVGDPSIAPGTDYNLQLLLQGSNARLLVNGVGKVGFAYSSAFSGLVGLGTENSLTRFDNLTVQQYNPTGGGTLPIQEDFDDGQAHFFNPQSGTWSVSAGRYRAAPTSVGGEAVSTLLINGGPASGLELDVLMNAAAGTGDNFSNGFLIFDYQGPTNFKYAGVFVGNQQWVVGRRDATGWHNDAVVGDSSIAPNTDYNLQLLLQGSKATLLGNGVTKTSFTYAAGFSGSAGLGTENSVTQFDNLTVKQSS
jgi:hypothetical protein